MTSLFSRSLLTRKWLKPNVLCGSARRCDSSLWTQTEIPAWPLLLSNLLASQRGSAIKQIAASASGAPELHLWARPTKTYDWNRITRAYLPAVRLFLRGRCRADRVAFSPLRPGDCQFTISTPVLAPETSARSLRS